MPVSRRLLLPAAGYILFLCPVSGQAASDEPDTVSRILMERPLFEPDRRSKEAPLLNTGHEELRLTGIAGQPGHWSAVFRGGTGGKKSEIRSSGQTIQGWTIRSVSRTGATLTRDSEIREMKPDFSFKNASVPKKSAAGRKNGPEKTTEDASPPL